MRLKRRDVLTLGAAVAAGFGVSALVRRASPIGIDVGDNATAREVLGDRTGPSGGDADGDIVMAVYTDFACPQCRIADAALAEAIAGRGGVRVLYRDWPILGAPSRNAAELAIAAHGLGRYERFAQELMQASSRLDDGDLEDAFGRAGGDWRTLLIVREQQRPRIAARLARHAREAFTFGLRGTPGFLVETRLVRGAISAGDFSRLFAQVAR